MSNIASARVRGDDSPSPTIPPPEERKALTGAFDRLVETNTELCQNVRSLVGAVYLLSAVSVIVSLVSVFVALHR